MTQYNNNLVRFSELLRDNRDAYLTDGVYDPTGKTAYGFNGEKIGTVRDALVDSATGRIRQLLVDVGGWFSSKEVVVPVGMARIDDSGVYFDNLTKDQVKGMNDYVEGQSYGADYYEANERVLRAADTDVDAYRAKAYETPDRLRLLEERLVVNKDKFVAGAVEIGKNVVTHQETVEVPLTREEVVIERHAVANERVTDGTVLGDTAAMRVELEAERANVGKETYVTEEVSIGKRQVTETQRVTETVGKEVLEVNKTGEVRVDGDATIVDNKNRK